MMARLAFVLALSFSINCFPGTACANDMPPTPAALPVDPDLPQPFDPAAFLPMLRNSPFNRVVDYTDTLQLTGVAWVDGRPMATFMDRQTKKQIIVSDEVNEQGWRLAEVSQGDDLRDAEIKLQVGDEIFPFHYSEAQINPITKPRAGNVPLAPSKVANASTKSTATPHIGTSAYLSPADKDAYRKMSKEVRDKFRDTMQRNEDKMGKMTDAQRASYSEKIFSKYKAQDQGTAPVKSSSKKARR